MVESKHTPGPWSAHEKGIHPNPYICGPEQEYEYFSDKPVIAYLFGDNIGANAHLIASAPAMLEVIAEACAVFDLNHEDGDEYNGDLASDLWKAGIHQKLADAIALARGV